METRSNLEPRTRRAVSTYIEVMVLMALVLGTSALVYVVATNISASESGGASVSISLATIRQGADAAIEKVTVANTGTLTVTSFTMTTVGVTSSSSCYLSILNPAIGATTSGACSFTGPVASGAISLPPGQSIIATVTVDVILFAIGSRYTIVVNAYPAALATAQAVATAA
jgi:hypothetical protein